MDRSAFERQVAEDVARWLDDVVIGENLCPFAARPRAEGRIRIHVSTAATAEAVLEDMQKELEHLSDTPVQALETTVMALPDVLADFDDYNQFLDLVDLWLQQFGWEGEFQVASFHPDYQFADTEADDAGNLTNRSPWPLLHLIREESLEAALAHFPDPESIPARNVQRMESLTAAERQKLFPYLFG